MPLIETLYVQSVGLSEADAERELLNFLKRSSPPEVRPRFPGTDAASFTAFGGEKLPANRPALPTQAVHEVVEAREVISQQSQAKIWQERIDFLLAREAVAVDPEIKFHVKGSRQLWPRPSPARCRVRRGSVCGASSGAAHGRGACTKVAKT